MDARTKVKQDAGRKQPEIESENMLLDMPSEPSLRGACGRRRKSECNMRKITNQKLKSESIWAAGMSLLK